MKYNKILSILIIIALSTILAFAYNASTNLSLRLLEATDDIRPFREDFNYNFELIDDLFDDVSLTEFGYLDGVTSAIQTQLGLRYLKTEMDSFSELQAIISDKTLVNVEDGITATAIQDDLILKADFADEDWGDMSVSANVVTLDAEVVDSDQYIDGSIDHEHLAPDVISGLVDVTSTDSDYILIWDATDSALKKVDMGEVRGAGGGDVTKVGTPVDNQVGVWTGDGTLEGDANLTYDGTTLVLGTGQINFPDAQNVSADANTLDDYEEGVHEVTATMSTSGTVTLDTSYDTFSYTKIGRLVTIVGTLVIDSVDSPVGTLRFSLPFTSANVEGNVAAAMVITYSVDYTSGTYCFGTVGINSAYVATKTAGDNITYGDVVPTAVDQYTFSFSYITD